MPSKRTVILKETDYDVATLKEHIADVLDREFSLFNNVSLHARILLKPNLLMAASAEEAIITHPCFIEAVGLIFKERGFEVFIADNPGGVFNHKNIQEIYQSSGLVEIAQRCGFELLYPKDSHVREEIPLSWWVDGFTVVNLPKLKTHDLAVFTLATKNLYGCISGVHKGHLHKMHPKTNDFLAQIIKLYRLIKPTINIVDGILAMEGDGPGKKGRPRKLDRVIVGDDCLSTDYAISQMLGVEEHHNPLLRIAKDQNLFDPQGVSIIADGDMKIEGFRLPSTFILNRIPDPLVKFVT